MAFAGPVPARQTAGALAGTFIAANAAGATLVFVYLNIVLPESQEERAFALASLLAFTAAITPLAAIRIRQFVVPVLEWLRSGTDPSPRQRRAVLAAPWRFAFLGLQFWLLAVVVFTALNVARDSPALETAQEAGGIFMGGLTTCALVVLLIERFMRPLFARVLTGAPHSRPSTIGIRPRLLGAWALGSGAPLLGILGAHVGPQRTDGGDVSGAVIFLATTGLAIGAFAIVMAARSVSDPVDRVRAGLRRVRAGDLDVEVPVDDGGELGLLQAGFNEMVEGLRQRAELQDLFGRHVGEDVAKHALEVGRELGGEVRVASTMFVDIVGSTGLTEQLAPDDVVSVLNGFFGAIVEAISAEGGVVNKFEGDGALCVFGAPRDQHDHAERALRAARVLAVRLRELRFAHAQLDAGIGVSCGSVVAGNVGAAERYEYTVIGDPVNEAARLTEAAKGRAGRTLASRAVIEAAGAEALHWREAGMVQLRGRSGPTEAFEPIP